MGTVLDGGVVAAVALPFAIVLFAALWEISSMIVESVGEPMTMLMCLIIVLFLLRL